jgi:pyruvate-formate lyase-activating enzyme
MNVIGVIEADLEVSGVGTPSRLARDLRGEPVLRRTIKRVLKSNHLSSVHVVVSPEQRARVSDLVAGLGVRVETHDAPPPIWREMVIAGRKWALDGWRGGLGGTCAFDEGFHPAVVGALARREGARAAACIPPAAVVFDPELLDGMLAHFERVGEKARLTFAQAPPGLAAAIWDTGVLVELGGASHPPGRLLAYQPDDPAHDPVVSDCGYKVSAEVTHTAGRFLADNRRSVEVLDKLLDWAGDSDDRLSVEAICRWSRERRFGEPQPLPREVELELTTADQLAGSQLRPRGKLVGDRGEMPPEIVERVVSEMSAYDDSLLVLGGFGEPLLHSEFARVVRACKPEAAGASEGGVFGLAVRTNALAMNDNTIALLIEAGVDVVSLMLDASRPETYRAVHGADLFEKALAGAEELVRAREEGGRGLPIIVPEMVKVAETVSDLESFFDEWTRKVGWANLEPFNCGAGRREDRAVMRMAPPGRFPCNRLWSRCLVLADGRVVRCDQDYTGAEPIGALPETSLGEIWRGTRMGELRAAHRAGEWGRAGMCSACEQWHRP